jgi:hypothetical protein
MLSLGLMLGALGGCITPDESKAAEATQATASIEAPEQVVQSNRPDPTSTRSATPFVAPGAAAAPSRTDAERLSATGVARTGESSANARRGELITPRHLEAELNRLEAELGR